MMMMMMLSLGRCCGCCGRLLFASFDCDHAMPPPPPPHVGDGNVSPIQIVDSRSSLDHRA